MSVAKSVDRSWFRHYAPLDTRARVTVIALGATVLAYVLSIFYTISEIELLNRLVAGEFVTDQEIETNDNRQAFLALAAIVAYVASVIAFCLWIYRASANLHSFGLPSIKFSPRATVIWWFVPIAAFFMPYRAVKEIWKGSDYRIADGSADWQSTAVWPLLGWWWAAWLISNWLGRFVGRSWLNAESPEEYLTADYFSVASDVVTVIAAILAILLVRHITERQQRKRTRLLAVSTGATA